jgi:hypothetical protein
MTRTLVTVVTEAVFERVLIAELEKLGASGYTISDARGSGASGQRASGWEPLANIRVEVVCSQALAQQLLATLRTRYYDDYSMVVWAHEVDVLRPEKFP